MFSIFTAALQVYGCIDLGSAAAMGQTQYNNNFGRNAGELVSVKKTNTPEEERSRGIGAFHLLSDKL